MENELTLLEYLKTLSPNAKIDVEFYWVYMYEDERKELDEEVSYYGVVDDFFNDNYVNGVSFAQDYEGYYDTYSYKILDTNEPIEIEILGQQW